MSTSVEIRVRGYHLDLYRHVNNARYLEFLEEARWALFEERCDLAYFEQHQLGFAVVNININYRQAATSGDTLRVSAEMSSIGSRSAVIEQRVVNAVTDELVADAAVTFVVVDGATGRAIELAGPTRELLERVAPDEAAATEPG